MLEQGLAALEITDDVVLVSHSYGGFLATLFAARHPKRIKGAVFVDANHVSFFTDGVVAALMASTPNARREQRGFRRRCHPDTLALRVENPPQ